MVNLKAFDEEQKDIINLAIKEGHDITVLTETSKWETIHCEFEEPVFNAKQMMEILLGLRDGLEVKWYTPTFYDTYFPGAPKYTPKYNAEQMEQIRLGLKENINITPYIPFSQGFPRLNASQMKQIRLGLIDGLNVSFYADSRNDALRMSILRQILKETKDKTPQGWFRDYNSFIEYSEENTPLYSNERLLQILFGMIAGVDYSRYDSTTYSIEQMEIIRDSLSKGLDISEYSNPNLNPTEMRAIQKEVSEKSQTELSFSNKAKAPTIHLKPLGNK